MIKIIPHVDCTPRICELVRYYCEDVTLKGAWSGPAALQLFDHALCDVAPPAGARSPVGHAFRHRSHARPRRGRPRLPGQGLKGNSHGSLRQKVGIITGAASGIGKEIACATPPRAARR
jgi:hypothetical protein